MRLSKRSVIRWAAVLAVAAMGARAIADDTAPAPHIPEKPNDLTKQKTLYAVGYAHLDTQWRWSYPQVVRDFLANTLHDNPPLLDKYPHYIFNFTGSRRYQLMKEYFPADYEKMKGYIKAGRWFPGGSNVDETDQNVPSAESVVRHVLYGNHFFKSEFGVCGVDFQVPDCFGFPYSLPTVLAHCSIKGFSTAKLRWGSASDFWKQHPVGVWEGVDGESVIASFDPTPYDSKVNDDLSQDKGWIKRAADAGKADGVYVDYRYYGTGDRGGAPAAKSVAEVEKSVTSDGPLHVISATSDQMFRDITPAERAKLPRYKGDLLLTWHSSGSINSQAFMKRMNRKNELLADAAERASVAAAWLGNAPYPTQKLYNSWMLLLEGQMHDILPGDCLPKCYEYSWNDEVLAANGFAAAELDGVGAIAAAMDTSPAAPSAAAAAGVSLVVYNPLSVDREDPVEASVAFAGPVPAAVAVTGPDGKPCAAQVLGRDGPGKLKVLFLAKVPGTAFATFDVTPAPAAPAADAALKVTPDSLENARYRVTLNAAGDVEQIVDKAEGGVHLLTAPIQLGFLHQNPSQFPAWNMDWEDRREKCQGFVDGPATVKVVEDGPVRVALEVTREARGSKFVQRVQLSAGSSGDRVEFPTHIDWQSTECSLEAVMPLTVAAPTATYDTQVGVTVRGNNNPRKYEVPQQQWLDVTAPDGHYGVSVLNDSKYGSDKPDDKTVRLTLLYTPGTRGGYQDEGSQDFGRHDFVYAVTGHAGDWRAGHSVDQAARLNQPLAAFQTAAHPGSLGKQFAMLSVSNPAVRVQAIKKAEDSDEVIVRLKETDDKPQSGVRLTFAAPVVSAREVDGQEAEIGKATVTDGKLVADLKPFHLRAYAVRLAPPAAPAAVAAVTPVTLPYDQDVASTVANLTDGSFDAAGRTYPAEQLPAELTSEGILFKLGPTADGQRNALSCRGQTVPLPAGSKRVYVLASSSHGDTAVQFKVGDRVTPVTVQDWGGYIGSWDNRLWKGQISELTYGWANRLGGLVPGFIKRDTVAWYADHRHAPSAGNGTSGGNEVWQYCYLFKYGFDVPAGATTLTLPDDANVRVFAVSAATGTHDDVTAARPLYDTLADHTVDGHPRAVVETEPSAMGPVAPAATGTALVADPDAVPTAAPAPVTYDNAIHVRLDRPLYWQDGSTHYTLDGTDPTAESPVYEAPLFISQPTTVKARQFTAAGPLGSVMTERFDVQDTTPPTIKSAAGMAVNSVVTVTFSEPVTKESAEDVANYKIEPATKVTAAHLTGDGTTVLLELGTGTHPAALHLTAAGVKDVSPAGNALKATTVAVDLVKPVFQLDAYSSAGDKPPLEQRVRGLPTKPTDPFTMNCLVRTDSTSDDMIAIAGFGVCQDGKDGAGRYLCRFSNNLHYWTCNQDVDSDRPLDTGKWQMLSAVWNGHVMTMYKDGQAIGSADLTLTAEQDPTVRLAPVDPWSKKNRFIGDIRDFSIWNTALPPRALAALWDAHAHD